MDLDPLGSALLLPSISTAAAASAEEENHDDLILPTIMSETSEDTSMLDSLFAFDQNYQSSRHMRMDSPSSAHHLWSGQFDCSSPPYSAETLHRALQQSFPANAHSPPATSNTPSSGASQTQCLKPEFDGDDMDLDNCNEDKVLFVGVVNIPEVNLTLCDYSATDSHVFGHVPSVVKDVAQTFRETPSSIQVHMVNIKSEPETAQQENVQRHNLEQQAMAHVQQKILSLQSTAQERFHDAQGRWKQLERVIQTGQSERPHVLQQTHEMIRILAQAVQPSRAAEDIVRSHLPCATSHLEAQALQQQSEDARRLSEKMVAIQQQVIRLGACLSARLARSTSYTHARQSSKRAQRQILQQDQAPRQPMKQLPPAWPPQQPLSQIPAAAQVNFEQVMTQTQQALGQQAPTQQALNQSQACSQQHAYAQQQALQARPSLQFTANPQRPRHQAMSPPIPQTTVSGQLFPVQARPNGHLHPSALGFAAHQDGSHSLRGGSSGDKKNSEFLRKVLNDDGTEDLQLSPSASRSERILGLPSRFQRNSNTGTAPTASQERTRVPTRLPNTTAPSAPRRIDPAVERMDEAALDSLVSNLGMDPDTVTREEKLELAQNDLDWWRSEQHSRIRAALHHNTQPSSPSAARSIGALNATPLSTINDYTEKIPSGLPHARVSEFRRQEQGEPRLQQHGRFDRKASHFDNLPRLSSRLPSGKVDGPTRDECGRWKHHSRSHDRDSRLDLRPGSSPFPYAQFAGRSNDAWQEERGRVQGHFHRSSAPPESLPDHSANFAEIVDEKTREVLAPGPGRCGIVCI